MQRNSLLKLRWKLISCGISLCLAVLVILCGVLATGISWSHIRRRITGQVDTDEIEEG